MKSYSGHTTWNFVNGVLFCLEIVTTIGELKIFNIKSLLTHKNAVDDDDDNVIVVKKFFLLDFSKKFFNQSSLHLNFSQNEV